MIYHLTYLHISGTTMELGVESIWEFSQLLDSAIANPEVSVETIKIWTEAPGEINNLEINIGFKK